MDGFFQGYKVGNGTTASLALDEANSGISFAWSADSTDLFTLMVYDLDTLQQMGGYFLHYMLINIPGNNLQEGQEVAAYAQLAPPRGQTHRYNYELYRQRDYIDFEEYLDRATFDPSRFIERFGLKYVGGFTVTTGSTTFSTRKSTVVSRVTSPVRTTASVVVMPPPSAVRVASKERKRIIIAKPVSVITSTTIKPRSKSPARNRSPAVVPSPQRSSSPVRSSSPRSSSSYSSGSGEHGKTKYPFKEDTWLTERQQKYCSCLPQVNEKGGVDNVFAVCASRTKTSTGRRSCVTEYDYDRMTDDQLMAIAHLHKIAIPYPYDRDSMMRKINGYVETK